MSKARYSRVSAKIDTGLRAKTSENNDVALDSPRAFIVSPNSDKPRLHSIHGHATDQPGSASERATRMTPRTTGWANFTMSPRREFQSEPAKFGVSARESLSSTLFGAEPFSIANSVWDEKEARRQSRAAKLAVQREVRSTTQVLRRTSADLKRLQTQKQQLDTQLERTAREQERTMLKREDVLRTLQAKDRSLDESLLSRAKEEGELLERLACLRRQLDESSALLPTGGPGREDEMQKLRMENKRLREQMRGFMKNASSLHQRTPQHPRVSSEDSTLRSSGSPGPSLDGMGLRRNLLGNASTARTVLYGPSTARPSMGGQARTTFCPQRMTYAPPPRIVPNLHIPKRVTRSCSPGGLHMPVTPVADPGRLSVPFMEKLQQKQLRPPNNLTARLVSAGHIAVPSMPPLPTVQLASPRDGLPDATVDLRSAIRRHVSMPPPQNFSSSTMPQLDRSFIRGITPVVGPGSILFSREDAKNKASLLSPRLTTSRLTLSKPVAESPLCLSKAASEKSNGGQPVGLQPSGLQPNGSQANVRANPPAKPIKVRMPRSNAVLL